MELPPERVKPSPVPPWMVMGGPLVQPAVVVMETPLLRFSPLVREITEPAERLTVMALLPLPLLAAVITAIRRVPQVQSSWSEVTKSGLALEQSGRLVSPKLAGLATPATVALTL